MEEEDPVEYEVDVYVGEMEEGKLRVVQYPLRPPWNGYPTESLVDVQRKEVKDRTQMVYEYARGEHYDGRDGRYPEAHRFALTSRTALTQCGYALASRSDDGSLVLHPVDCILQMRPSLAHIDSAQAKDDPLPTALSPMGEASSMQQQGRMEEEGDQPKMVTQTYNRRRGSEIYDPHRIRSASSMRRRELEQSWESVRFATRENAAAEVADVLSALGRPPATEEGRSYVSETQTGGHFSESSRSKNVRVPSGSDSLTHVRRLATEDEQVRRLLQAAGVLTFRDLCQCVFGGRDGPERLRQAPERFEALCAAVAKHTYTVRGALVCCSALAYENRGLAEHELRMAVLRRDYVLWRVWEDGEVRREQVARDINLTREETRTLLASMLQLDRGRHAWTMRLGADDLWRRWVPALDTREREFWTAKRDEISAGLREFHLYAGLHLPDGQRKSDEEMVVDFAMYCLRRCGVLRLDALLDMLVEHKYPAPPLERLEALLAPVAVKIMDVWALRASGRSPEMEFARGLLIRALAALLLPTRRSVNLAKLRRECRNLARADGGRLLQDDVFAALLPEFAVSHETRLGSEEVFLKSGDSRILL